MPGSEALTPAEHLRLALLDLQRASRDFAERYADPAEADVAAKQADEARVHAARWGALVRASYRLDE